VPGVLGVTPLAVFRIPAYSVGIGALVIFLNMFVYDFFYYWFHRLQHTCPPLWRLHAVHHSIKNLNSVMSFHHPIEEFLKIIPIALPLSLLWRLEDPGYIPLASAFIVAWGQFIHTDSLVNFGRARMVLGDGHYHRIHHSERPEHWNKNFAAFFPVWDWVFGTLHMPRPNEHPAVGLSARPDGIKLREYLVGVATGRS